MSMNGNATITLIRRCQRTTLAPKHRYQYINNPSVAKLTLAFIMNRKTDAKIYLAVVD